MVRKWVGYRIWLYASTKARPKQMILVQLHAHRIEYRSTNDRGTTKLTAIRQDRCAGTGPLCFVFICSGRVGRHRSHLMQTTCATALEFTVVKKSEVNSATRILQCMKAHDIGSRCARVPKRISPEQA